MRNRDLHISVAVFTTEFFPLHSALFFSFFKAVSCTRLLLFLYQTLIWYQLFAGLGPLRSPVPIFLLLLLCACAPKPHVGGPSLVEGGRESGKSDFLQKSADSSRS